MNQRNVSLNNRVGDIDPLKIKKGSEITPESFKEEHESPTDKPKKVGEGLVYVDMVKISVLNSVILTLDYVMMGLSIYCVGFSAFTLVQGQAHSNYFEFSLVGASGIMAFLNAFRYLIFQKVEEEYSKSTILERNLTANLRRQFSRNLLHTILIMIVPNELFKMIPTYHKKAPSYVYIDCNLLAHIIQLNKMYFIANYFLGSSKYYSDSAFRVCSLYGSARDWIFVIKCKMRKSPVGILALIMGCVIFIFTYSVYVAENELPRAMGDDPFIADFKTATWLICITVTTVGYGDEGPSTKLGKLLMLLACLCGIVLFSLFVSSITEQLEMDANEEVAYGLICKLDLKEDLKEKAWGMLQKLAILKKENKAKDRNLIKQLEEKLNALKVSRRDYNGFEVHNPVSLEVHFEVVNRELTHLTILINGIYAQLQSEGMIRQHQRDTTDFYRKSSSRQSVIKAEVNMASQVMENFLEHIEEGEYEWEKEHIKEIEKEHDYRDY